MPIMYSSGSRPKRANRVHEGPVEGLGMLGDVTVLRRRDRLQVFKDARDVDVPPAARRAREGHWTHNWMAFESRTLVDQPDLEHPHEAVLGGWSISEGRPGNSPSSCPH